MITFRLHNLIQPLTERPFDMVFLKNVLIYFDAASKQTVVDHVRAMIRPRRRSWPRPEGVGELFDDFTRLSLAVPSHGSLSRADRAEQCVLGSDQDRRR